MKVLCLCQYGHSRSVAMARALHKRKIAAIAAGVSTAGPWLDKLCDWADAIVVMQPGFADAPPSAHRHKVRVCDVGPDRWVNPYHPELASIVEAWLNQQEGLA